MDARDDGASEYAPDPRDATRAAQSIETAAFLGIVASAATVLSSVVRSKVTAVYLGSAGLGRSALVLQFFQLAVVPLGMVTGPALVASLSSAYAAREDDRAQRIYDTTLSMLSVASLVTFVVGCVVSIVAIPEAARAELVPLVPLAGAFCLGQVAAGVAPRVLVSRGDLRRNTWLTLVATLASIAFVSLGTVGFGLRGQMVGLACAPILAIAVGSRFTVRAGGVRRALPRFRFDRAQLHAVATLGVASLIAAGCLNASLTAMRLVLEAHGGARANGQFQAAFAVSTTYFGAILGGIGAHVFPRFATADGPEALQRLVDEAHDFVLRFGPPVILAAIALRAPLMHVLYSGEFDLAAEMVGLQMAADLAKAASWVQAGPLLYRRRTLAFLFTEVAGAALLAGGTALLVPRFGAYGAACAYALAYVIYFPLTYAVLSRSLGVRTKSDVVVRVVSFTALAMVAVFASRRYVAVDIVLIGLAIGLAVRGGLHREILRRARRRLGRGPTDPTEPSR